MKRFLFIALLLMVAGLQTMWGQGFRVYKSDGTIAQFSLRTDSIVFYDGIGTDVDFGPFTPVNQMIVGTWYKIKQELTFNEDGTTNYIDGATYKFFPYQGTIIIYNASDAPVNIFKVHEVTADRMIVNTLGGKENFFTLNRTPQPQPVTEIVLSDESLNLQPGNTYQLSATVLPQDAENPAVTWESSNPEVVKVYDDGLVNAKAEGSCVITCCATDGSGVKAECQVTVSYQGIIDGHEWVDLGLPSGTLWATCNIGANSPGEYGDYFAWGEIRPKEDYSWDTYWWVGSVNPYTVTKYCFNYGYQGYTDNLTELEPYHDAATANWGEDWQMPSKEQQQELINSNFTKNEWGAENGFMGIKITSLNNGKSIFLPFADFYAGTSLFNSKYGIYWSRSLSLDNSLNASVLEFNNISEGYLNTETQSRARGLSIRPVRKQ